MSSPEPNPSAWLRLLRITPREARRIAPFALLAILGSGGLAVGLSVSSSLFLVHLGPDKLPVLYLGMPVVMAVYTPVSSLLLRRFGIGRVYHGILTLLTLGGLALTLAMTTGSGSEGALPAPLLYAASFYTGLWYIALYTLFWSFTGDFFDIRDAKRFFPLLTGSMALGSSLGGVAVTLLTGLGLVGELYVVWSLTALAARLPLGWIRRQVPRLDQEDDELSTHSFGEQLREVGRSFLRVRYVPLLCALMVTGMMLAALCNFEALTLLSDGRNEVELAALLGQLYALANGFNLVVNLLVFNRLVARLGVPGTALILPLAFLAVFGALAVEPALWVGILGFFVLEGLLWSVELNNQNFLFNALPTATRRDLRLLLEGLAEPLSTAAVGLALLLTQRGETSGEDLRQLAQLGIVGSLVAIALVWMLRGDYLAAMVVNLRRHWLDFSRPGEAVVRGLGDDDLAPLEERLTLDDLEGTTLALRIFFLNDPQRALDRLLDLLVTADPDQSKVLAPILGQALDGGEAEVVHKVMEALEPIRQDLAPAILDELGRHRLLTPQRFHDLAASDDDPERRTAAAVGLLNAWAPSANRRGLELVDGLLAGDPTERRHGLCALGRSGQERYTVSLLPFLRDPRAPLRHAALEALGELATPQAAYLLPALLALLTTTRDSQERLLVLDNLETIADPDSLEPLMQRVGSFTPFELRRCERLATSMGLKSVPRTVEVLRNPSYSYKARSIAARVLGKLAPGQLEALSPQLIEAELTLADDASRRAAVLAEEPTLSPGLTVLHRFYRDLPRAPVDFILELLSIGGRLPDFELLASSLRSQNPRLRGDALETLEQGLDRSMFLRLLPRVSETNGSDGPRTAFHPHGEDPESIVCQALASPHPLEVGAALEVARDRPSPALGATLDARLLQPLSAELLQLLDPPIEQPNRIVKLAHLAGLRFFDRFEIAALEPLAEQSTLCTADPGEPLPRETPADPRFYAVLEGGLRCERHGRVRRVGAGDVVGASQLLRPSLPPPRLTSEGARWLALPIAVLRNAARHDSTLAQQLLEFHNPSDNRWSPS